MKFKLQNYNEFKNGIRWHDYVSIIINEFPIILIRKYDDPHNDSINAFITIQIIGITMK
jgi:hypothetical protein